MDEQKGGRDVGSINIACERKYLLGKSPLRVKNWTRYTNKGTYRYQFLDLFI
jgi:hypothetical protein